MLFSGHGCERPWARELADASQSKLEACSTLLAPPFTQLRESEEELWGLLDQLSVSAAQDLHLSTAPLQLQEPMAQLWEPRFYLFTPSM
ncbi:hypothetical protein ACXR0O_20245 [Verrucomicrobiota bacterium sgz303538]